MVIVGNGQLARRFQGLLLDKECILFASGVSNSRCTDVQEFEREEKLLKDYLHKAVEGQLPLIYFSSCALSDNTYPLNQYYRHKLNMEKLIKGALEAYYIFRLPQLFGPLKQHPTLINFLYFSILRGEEFNLSKNAYRYVLDLDDLHKIVLGLIESVPAGLTLDLANPFRYSVPEIVSILEKLVGINAKYTLVDKSDMYTLELSKMNTFLRQNNLEVNDFGKDYLEIRLKKRLERAKRK